VSKISWFEPQPRQKPKRLPRRRPIKVVPSAIGDQGIVANWLFYYLKGGDHLHDFSLYDNHGTINGPVWKDGRYGWALDFDGSDDYVKVPNDASFEFGAGATFSFGGWFKTSDTGGLGEIVSYQAGGGGGNELWKFRYKDVDDDGNSEAQAQVRDNNLNLASLSSNAHVDDGSWHYVMVVVDASNNDFYLYLDGSLADSTTSAGWTGDFADSKPIYFGCLDPTSELAQGSIDLVRVYKVMKSDSWVSRRFEQTKGIFSV